MDQFKKKRLWVRGPLTFEEELGGKTYYSAKNIEGIYLSFSPRADLDQPEFERRLERVAWFFVEMAAVDPERAPRT